MNRAEKFFFDDFTEEHYLSLLALAKKNYSFEYFGTKETNPHILWRHDIDLSVHRALRLAEIEAKENIQATYFFLLHSEFYNLFEKDVFSKAQEIAKLGHHIGLHFDIGFYENLHTAEDLEKKLIFEKNILENIFACKINVFSIHNPTTISGLDLHVNVLGGMINSYGQTIMSNYSYCSDSNGYWRFNRLYDVLNDKSITKLQVLTHPGWWVPEAMSPRERISRCINGRAQATHIRYDNFLSKYERDNIV